MLQPSAPYQPFALSVEPSREEVALVPIGEIDLASIGLVQREARDLYRAGFDHVLIDLRQVTFMDSAGLCGLLELRNECRRTGRNLALVPGPPTVHRLFRITGTRGLFEWSGR
jgi:anti-sigma B factor antagonist